jgi:hypothetical protein
LNDVPANKRVQPARYARRVQWYLAVALPFALRRIVPVTARG